MYAWDSVHILIVVVHVCMFMSHKLYTMSQMNMLVCSVRATIKVYTTCTSFSQVLGTHEHKIS